MSNLKMKIVFQDDIRMFKRKSSSIELFNDIISFVKETHNIKLFRLVYKDNEGDEITIANNDDLEEALNSNNNNNKTIKLYVKKIKQEEILKEESTSSESDENNGTRGGWVLFGGFGRHRHHRSHGHHKHHGRGHRHHGHHGRKFGRHGHVGMHKHCGFKKFGGCKKDKDLEVDLISESLNKNEVVTGDIFLVKTWKLKNVGNKKIPSDCSIEYFGRRFNLMIDGSKFPLKNKEIDINEEFEVRVVVKSPKENGKYRSKWKLITPDGKKFGKALFVSFIVNDGNNSSDKLLKKQEKLKNKKAKLLQKLQFLQEKSNKLNNDNNSNNNDKDDIKEDIEGNEIQNSSSSSDENEFIKQNRDEYNGNYKFLYEIQLEQLKNMGFNNEDQLKELLELNYGSIEAVINNIMKN